MHRHTLVLNRYIALVRAPRCPSIYRTPLRHAVGTVAGKNHNLGLSHIQIPERVSFSNLRARAKIVIEPIADGPWDPDRPRSAFPSSEPHANGRPHLTLHSYLLSFRLSPEMDTRSS